MNGKLTEQQVEELCASFADILIPGGTICRSAPLPEEADEPGLSHLPRLLVDFDRRCFARLRCLIDAVNHGLQPDPGDGA
jgi:hypothetical protein